MPCRFPGPHPGGKLGRSGRGLSRPTPKGAVEGDLARGVSRPTPKGEVEGDLARGVSRPTSGGLQAHTQGGGSIPACTETDHPDGYYCGQYVSYWNAFLLCVILTFITSVILTVNVQLN